MDTLLGQQSFFFFMCILKWTVRERLIRHIRYHSLYSSIRVSSLGLKSPQKGCIGVKGPYWQLCARLMNSLGNIAHKFLSHCWREMFCKVTLQSWGVWYWLKCQSRPWSRAYTALHKSIRGSSTINVFGWSANSTSVGQFTSSIDCHITNLPQSAFQSVQHMEVSIPTWVDELGGNKWYVKVYKV